MLQKIFRSLSLYLRRNSDRKDQLAVLKRRKEWIGEIEGLPAYRSGPPLLGIVRLDDIGDYLLFRNFLQDYKQSERWHDYRITLIGNKIWKPLLEQLDQDTVDAVIWVDKKQYWTDAAYRYALWLQLRQESFTALVCPSRTRPLLLDDMLVLAAAAPACYGVTNTYAVPEWNQLSDKIYMQLFPAATDTLEFDFNRHFSNWINNGRSRYLRPELPAGKEIQHQQIICFIGASAKSKRWPLSHWIRLVQLLQEKNYLPLIAGGPGDVDAATAIVAATGVASTTGTTSLPETLTAISVTHAVISGDTMAAHAAVAAHKPVVILANGVNAQRFVAYDAAGISGVTTLYTRAYLDAMKRAGEHPASFVAVSDDMKTIAPDAVWAALQQLLPAG